MNIVHTIASLDPENGGTSTCLYCLTKGLNENKHISDIISFTKKNNSEERISLFKDNCIHLLENDKITPFGFSRNIKNTLSDSDYDLYHTHGLWMYCNHITCITARKKNKPYIITPHGMLYPGALKRSYWKKWLMLQLYFKKDIQKANCIVATCKAEMKYIRNFGYKGPIAVIPNSILIPEYIPELKHNYSKRIFGFLGRLHPIKGVEKIIYAMANVRNNLAQSELWIIGSGSEKYESFLKQEVNRLNLSDHVKFLGFLDGREKYEKLSQLSLLIVPSDFENFGMIIPEALSVGTPVFASIGTPWEELNTNNCGWWMERSIDNISKVILKIVNMKENELVTMGENGKRLVLSKYTIDNVAYDTIKLYDWIINKKTKPDFIYY